jgi:choice-of-anchor A domain-containing protein
MKTSTVLSLLIIGAIPALSSASDPFFGVGNENVFTSGDLTANVDIEGQVAAGGSITMSGYSVGLKNQGGNAVVAGNGVSLHNGSVYGNVVYGATSTISGSGITGTVSKGSAIDFSAVTKDLSAASTAWSSLAETGTVYDPGYAVQLTGTSKGLNVFDLTAAEMKEPIYIDVPAGATVLVNVSGTAVTFGNSGIYSGLINHGGSLMADSGTLANNLLWNLNSATSISLSSTSGSILAMNASITDTYGAVWGQIFAKSLSGPDQINWTQFGGGTALPHVNTSVPAPAPFLTPILGLVALGRRTWRRAKKS